MQLTSMQKKKEKEKRREGWNRFVKVELHLPAMVRNTAARALEV